MSVIRSLLCKITLLKGRVFPVVSWNKNKNRTEWRLRMFTYKMGCIVAITQKTFSANFWYQQMNKRLLQLLQVSDFLIFRSIYLCPCFKMKINKLHTIYRVQIPKLHGLLTRSYTLHQLTPEDSPGTLSTVSIGWFCHFHSKKLLTNFKEIGQFWIHFLHLLQHSWIQKRHFDQNRCIFKIDNIFKGIFIFSRDVYLKQKAWEMTCILWAMTQKKPVFGVCDQGRLRPACAATEAR